MIEQLDRSQAPPLKAITDFVIPEALMTKLDNGIPVHSINAGFQDLVKVELLFPNPAFDPAAPLLRSAANRMLPDGTKKHTALELADMVDYYGAFLETENNPDHCSIVLFTLNKYLDQTLPVIREILSDAIFPESELAIYRQNHKQRLKVENEKVGTIARKKFNEMIFGSRHSYGYNVKAEDYDALSSDLLQQYRPKQYISSNCTVIVSGLVSDKTLTLINRDLGDKNWDGTVAEDQAASAFQPDQHQKVFLPKEGAVQSAIRIGKVLFNRAHPDYPGMSVLNTILGGNFGSRLMSNIREEKGYTYGIGSGVVSMKQDGYFYISTEVGADVTSAALEEIYKEIGILRKEPVGTEELEMVRNYMLGNFMKGMDGAFNLADRFKAIHLNGLGYDYFQRYIQKLRTIRQDEILALAVKYLDPAGFHELVVGSM